MIPTSDGSRAKELFARIEPKAAGALHDALAAAIAKASEITAEAAALAAPDKADAILQAVQDNVTPIENTALDAAADVLAAQAPHGEANIGAAIAAGTAAAVAGGMTLGKVRGDMYHAGSVLGDVEAVASGNPEKIVRRGAQHIFWRAFGKAGRGIFRKIGGK
ncbi:MAG: hypothetical protein ACYDCA_06585 [Candidatus Tyrphobacter sp.]